MRVFRVVCFCWLAFAAGVRGDTTVNLTNRLAYGANVGWVDARGDVDQGAVFGVCYASGYLWSANAGWIALGNGPSNGWHYTNTSGSDWGVNHDGAGRLSGFAYGANIGWIAFEQTHGKPRIDLLTGDLSGFAWSANAGWIGLSNTQARVVTDLLETGPDSDTDGIPDVWEYQSAGGLGTLDGASDSDGDGASDADEAYAGTDPLDGDSLFAITAISVQDGESALTWPVVPTRLYRLVQADVLQPAPPPWADSGLGLIAPGLASELTAYAPVAGATQRLFRVRAVVPLSE